LFLMFLNLEKKKRKSIQFFYIFSGFSWIFLNLVDFVKGFWAVKREYVRKLLSQFCVSRHHPMFGFIYSLLILSEINIVLSGRSLCFLSPIVYIIVYSVVCQVAVLPSSNSLSIVYSALYSLSPIYSCL